MKNKRKNRLIFLDTFVEIPLLSLFFWNDLEPKRNSSLPDSRKLGPPPPPWRCQFLFCCLQQRWRRTTRRGVAQEGRKKWQAEAKRTRAAGGFTQRLPFPWIVTPFCQVPTICGQNYDGGFWLWKTFLHPIPPRPIFGVIPFGWGVGWP